MQPKSKEEITQILGTYSFFERAGKRLFGNVSYLGGLPAADERLRNRVPNEHNLEISILPKGFELKIDPLFNSLRFGVPFDRIEYVTIEPQHQIVEKKQKSILGRALVGGILLGPVGAIVGGMTGVASKQVKLISVDNILLIKLANPEELLTFSVKNTDFSVIETFWRRFTPNNYRTPAEIEHLLKIESNTSFSLSDELTKLKELVDKGILTETEFLAQKEKLLNR